MTLIFEVSGPPGDRPKIRMLDRGAQAEESPESTGREWGSPSRPGAGL